MSEAAATQEAPQEHDSQAAEFEQLEREIMQEAANDAGPVQQPQQQQGPGAAEVLFPILQMGFGVMAPNWNVQDSEVQQLAECYGQLTDKYFPDGLGDYGVEISAVMVTAAIVLPRLKLPRKVEQKAANDSEYSQEAANDGSYYAET
jgi:hypothetical protein